MWARGRWGCCGFARSLRDSGANVWLARLLDHRLTNFRQFVEEQNPMMAEADFTRPWIWSAADRTCIGNRVMRRAERPRRDERGVLVKQAQGNRKVKRRPLFLHVRRGHVDGNLAWGELKSAVLDCGHDPFLALPDSSVRKAYNREAGQHFADIGFDAYLEASMPTTAIEGSFASTCFCLSMVCSAVAGTSPVRSSGLSLMSGSNASEAHPARCRVSNP